MTVAIAFVAAPVMFVGAVVIIWVQLRRRLEERR